MRVARHHHAGADVALPRLTRHQIRLDVSLAGDLPPIKVDATQLEMALLNLVTNALDAMPGGGTLSIAATAPPDGLRVEVADTGPGILTGGRSIACSSRG